MKKAGSEKMTLWWPWHLGTVCGGTEAPRRGKKNASQTSGKAPQPHLVDLPILLRDPDSTVVGLGEERTRCGGFSYLGHPCLKQFDPGDFGGIFRLLFLRNKPAPKSNDLLFLPIWWVGNLGGSSAGLAWDCSCSCSYLTVRLGLEGSNDFIYTPSSWCWLRMGNASALLYLPPILQRTFTF